MATFFTDWSGYPLTEFPSADFSEETSLDAPGSMTVQEDGVALTAGRVLRAASVGGFRRYALLDALTGNDHEVVAYMRFSALTTWNGAVAVRATNDDNVFWFGVYAGTNARIAKKVGGSSTSTVQTIDFSYAPDEWIGLRFRAHGELLYAKVWKVADGEPGAWSIDGASNTDLATGKPGVAAIQTSTTVMLVDRAGFGTGGDTAPLSAATATPLATPTGFTFTAHGSLRQLNGAWDAVTSAESYDWEVEVDDGGYQPFESGSTAGTSFQLDDSDGVDWQTNYRGRVRANPEPLP